MEEDMGNERSEGIGGKEGKGNLTHSSLANL